MAGMSAGVTSSLNAKLPLAIICKVLINPDLLNMDQPQSKAHSVYFWRQEGAAYQRCCSLHGLAKLVTFNVVLGLPGRLG